MVKLNSKKIFLNDDAHAIDSWVESTATAYDAAQKDQLRRSCLILLDWHKSHQVPLEYLQKGAVMVEVVAELRLDMDTLIATLIYPAARYKSIEVELLKETFPGVIASLVLGTEKMDAVKNLRPSFDEDEEDHYEQQLDNIRKMLLAMVEDVRVVLIKLAEQIYLMQEAKNKTPEQQVELATRVREIYAPLANRLGVGHIKWQLEDWAFRYLEPEQYKQIAQFISQKRDERQQSIDDVIEELKQELENDGITNAHVQGRVKHIYSIWRKMQRKNVQYSEVYDVRAVRIIVDEVGQCYGALGTVHRLWKHIPKEFDDYIAQPKPNGYRSLHTAVVGPLGKALEVQIRTPQMHEESELGVCAHWAYKEGGGTDSNLQAKINWLRSLLDWQEEIATSDELAEERVYIFTPKGEVLDLPKGSTPLDFAYQVHTQIGHRTRGAKINGRIVPLTYVLNTGEQVEILTQSDAKPGRDWLHSESGFVFTARARAKVRAWFREQHRDENMAAGRDLIEKECDRLGLPYVHVDDVAARFNFKEGDDVLAAVGRGDLRVTQLIHAAYGHLEKQITRDDVIPLKHPSKRSTRPGDITIQGVGNLLTVMAHCCHPVPGDAIIGYVTQGRGVSVHRQDCSNVVNFLSDSPKRILDVAWGTSSDKTYPVRVLLKAYDRKYLLRDITSVLSGLQVNVSAISSRADEADGTVTFNLTLEIPDLGALGRLLERLHSLPNVISASRYATHL